MVLATNENLSQDSRDSISIIVKSSQYLLRLVELTRLLANLDRNRVDLTQGPVNINDILLETPQRVGEVTSGKTVSVSINSPVAHGWYLCDVKALTTILDSIIELVSRHTPTPGTLKVALNVQLSPAGFSTGQCCVDIRVTRANDARAADTFQQFLTEASREESLVLPPSFEFILLSVASKLASLHGGSVKSVTQTAESGLVLTLPTLQSVATPGPSPASTAPSTPKSTHSSPRLPGIPAQQSNGRLLAPPTADVGTTRLLRRSSTGAPMVPLQKSPSLTCGDSYKGVVGSGTTTKSDSSSNGSSALVHGTSNLAVKANAPGAPTMGMSRSDSVTPAMRPRRSSSPAAPPKKKTVVPSVVVEPVSIESTTSDSGNGSDILRASRANGMQRSMSLRPLDEYQSTHVPHEPTKEAGMPPDCQLVKPKTPEQRHLLVVVCLHCFRCTMALPLFER
ncbi:hypothetical protein BCR44DRAFT_1462106 [Catenaria anguillulae PL171]|uniref:Histidine kinase domain-containing protein n=1 Tax=Catenaria anguillulae PL171 TaxID=765915 RepID=A0A1Y2HHW6_9FUNG|nr:hypothetical protein BCR44DRAFT_1462106 [Catenaria anguillulae PL171]